jgi:hypothetical protein
LLTFQAVDDSTVYVLGSNGTLWREHGNMNTRDWVDGNVLAFQAIDATNVDVLGSDGNLWHENGSANNRWLIDRNVLRFQDLGNGAEYVLDGDANLWRESGGGRALVDSNVRSFHARVGSPDIIYVLGSDGKLWREYGNFNTRNFVDANVLAFQDVWWSTTEVDVLGTDGNLWKEFGSATQRRWIDGFVRCFQDVGGGQHQIFVLATNGNLWSEFGDMHVRNLVDQNATAFEAFGAYVYVLGADGKLWRESGNHFNRGLIDQNVFSYRIMTNPEVVLIFWGHDYQTNSSLASTTSQFFNDVLTGSFLNGAAQYGIGRGAVVSTVFIDEPLPPPGTRPVRSWVDIENDVKNWLNKGTIARLPAVNETNVMYFVVPPPEYELYLGSDPTKPSLGIQGIHWHIKYNPQSTQDDLLLAVIKTYHPEDASKFILSSDVMGHELIESFNDPLGGREELGDPCENLGDYQYLGKWSVQEYWSDRSAACIHGDQP